MRRKHALFYMYFLRAILGLPSQKIEEFHLVALLEWLKIIPFHREAGAMAATSRGGPKVENNAERRTNDVRAAQPRRTLAYACRGEL